MSQSLRSNKFTGLLLGVALAIPAQVSADDAPSVDPLLAAMQDLAASARVTAPSGTPLKLIPTPAFRYSDQPRNIQDATLWIWTDGERPIALQKVEAVSHDDRDSWTICWSSLSPELLQATWPDGRELDCSRPGVEFRSLPNPPELEADRLQPLHVRHVARRFSASIVNDPNQKTIEQMRLLPRPVFEYVHPDSGLLAGALFGFASNGTNPDAYVIIEAQRSAAGNVSWQYAWVRMTSGGVTAMLDDQPVWSCDWVRPTPIPRENWMFFPLPRDGSP